MWVNKLADAFYSSVLLKMIMFDLLFVTNLIIIIMVRGVWFFCFFSFSKGSNMVVFTHPGEGGGIWKFVYLSVGKMYCTGMERLDVGGWVFGAWRQHLGGGARFGPALCKNIRWEPQEDAKLLCVLDYATILLVIILVYCYSGRYARTVP